MDECEDNHIPTCVFDNKADLLSRFFAPLLLHMEARNRGKEMLEDNGESFDNVGELYFASP